MLPLSYFGNLHIRCDDNIRRRHVTIIRTQQSTKSIEVILRVRIEIDIGRITTLGNQATFFHHSLLPITRRGFLWLALITSDIRELITLWRSTLLQEILDFARSIYLTKGVIHTGSLDESLTDLSGMHLSIRVWIFFFHIIHKTVYIIPRQQFAPVLRIPRKINTLQYFTILYLTTQHPGVIRNSFKHVRETKSIENKRNSLKLPL